jgi:hypothetical protein
MLAFSPKIARQQGIYESSGNRVPDTSGNIVGTAGTGESYSWLRG